MLGKIFKFLARFPGDLDGVEAILRSCIVSNSSPYWRREVFMELVDDLINPKIIPPFIENSRSSRLLLIA